jgi:glycosyltransferase involved in cell wall biosynthesis
VSRFKIVSCGWECAQFAAQTLRSIERQSAQNFDVMIMVDPSSDGTAEFVEGWCAAHDPVLRMGQAAYWNCVINRDHRGAVANQASAIWLLEPKDDDIVIWLDLDGDQLAQGDTLAHLFHAYAEDPELLLTYGNYRPIPDHGTCPPAQPYPDKVVLDNSYRAWHRQGGGFNHLRTMKGKVAKAITEADLSWSDGRGWYEAGSDYHFMINGLELAGGRYKCLSEVMCLYNNANPRADNLTHPDLTARCVADMLGRPPKEPLDA